MHEILIEEKILAKNGEIASENRSFFKERKIFAVNIVSSPGAGKTAIIEKTVPLIKDKVNLAVIEGDLATDLDARRLLKFGIPVKQITTGKACHLDAHNISHILPWVLEQKGVSLLIIENVGNMVCPAEYDLGESIRVVVMSVAEGDDKPLKYPAIFSSSDALLLNKIDLLGHTDFDIDKAKENALKINPYLKILETSCRTGEGINEWCAFLEGEMTGAEVKA
ncbi:MAG: hydrogenase nickel incorporation protein HypB [Deltaproteobacteria bacterium]|nr:hydrogenase nickel incorporation protein HypB [Deltaproteobacteria bacterium]